MEEEATTVAAAATVIGLGDATLEVRTVRLISIGVAAAVIGPGDVCLEAWIL